MLVRVACSSRLFVKFERIRLQDGTRTDYKCVTSRSNVPTIRNGWGADAIGQCRHRVNTVVIRISVIVVIISVLCGSARADEPDAEKMSNDRPDRPLQMPPASSETKEAFDDFERFARRGAWERATKALYAIPEAQAARFVDGPNGFIVSVAHKRRTVLAGLSPEGQAAYRLFYDSDAKKLLDQAEGAAEQATLERLYSSYFLTSVGDNAADRLGDLYFEQGQFDRAADCWLAILRERPDSELSPALMTVKAALALARAGRRSELDALRSEAADRYADEVVTIGGRKAKAAEHLKRILGELAPSKNTDSSSSGSDGPAPDLAETVSAAWQVRFGASVTAGMTPVELSRWETTSFSGAVPAVAIEGQTLFANYLGHVFAVDLASGKMLWRSASFHNLEQATMQGPSQSIDTKRFAILAAPGHVWSLGRDVKDPNYQAEFRLVCRRAESGDVIWQSADLPDYAGMDFVGPPILARDTLFVSGKSSLSSNSGQDNQPRQYVLAIRPHDGKLLWKTEVGIFREGERYYWYYGSREPSAQPRLVYRAGSVYVDTHNGVLARLDAESGTVDWGYGYPTDPVQSQGRFFIFWGMMQEQAPTPAASSSGAGGRHRADQGAQVGSSLRDRPGPDEGRVGPRHRQVGTPDRGGRHDPVSRGPGTRGPRPPDAFAPLDDAPAGGQQRRAPARAARRALAAHAPGHLRGRPADGTCPADLPGEGRRRGGRRPVPDRPLAAGDQQSYDLGLSAQVGRGRENRPRGRGGTQNEGGRMIRSDVAVIFSTAMALAISACPAVGQFSEGPTGRKRTSTVSPSWARAPPPPSRTGWRSIWRSRPPRS